MTIDCTQTYAQKLQNTWRVGDEIPHDDDDDDDDRLTNHSTPQCDNYVVNKRSHKHSEVNCKQTRIVRTLSARCM